MDKRPETDDNDDIPVSALIARKVSEAASQVSAPEPKRQDNIDSDPDSDDDIPVLNFIKKRLAKVAEEAAKEKEKEREKRKREERDAVERKKEKPSKREPDPVTEKPKPSSSSNLSKSSQFYSSCDKGRLVQSLLIRWWYAYDWPRPEDIGVPPSGYESLDGFPGVFVSTRVRIL